MGVRNDMCWRRDDEEECVKESKGRSMELR